MVTLLGMGGIGKSMLASYLGLRLYPQFEAVLWRSVRDAPSCEDLVADCLTFFSENPPDAFPSSLEQRIDQLLARLQAHRCLLVLTTWRRCCKAGTLRVATCPATRATDGSLGAWPSRPTRAVYS